MTTPIFSREKYLAMNAEQIAIEREMDSLKASGVPESDERMKSLHGRWELLEYLSNA